ncbi:hypothetical protein EYZ11_007025 [Aspergillus tanneri]|uniref:ADP-ribosylglycohydrolase n=1 Tax=Aspergillus tanneri TaxID=1220188 RepID=A0A4S3JJM4_9EURO|nr:hypothetical protein EYZ11_007025 [Aspergillus tanneri]
MEAAENATPREITASGLDFLSLHPFVRQTVLDRIRGAVFGAALGDAVGLYTEFLSRDMSLAAYPEGRFQLVYPATEPKNDGHRGKNHLPGLPLGLGRTIGSIVTDRNYLNDPKATAYNYWVKGKYHAAPNGSLMRAYPLGILCLEKAVEITFHTAAEYSVVTHADPRCVVSCCLVTGLIRGLLRGQVFTESDVDAFIPQCLSWVDQWIEERSSKEGNVGDPRLDHEEFYRHLKVKRFDELQLDDAMTMGYVYKTLGAAILCLRLALRHSSGSTTTEMSRSAAKFPNAFENLLTTLILQGGDADTNACVAGALLGALMGFNSLPSHWRDGLAHSQWLLNKCDALISVTKVNNETLPYKGSEDPDTSLDGGKGVLTREELEAREKAFVHAYMARLHLGRDQPEKGWLKKLLKHAQ